MVLGDINGTVTMEGQMVDPNPTDLNLRAIRRRHGLTQRRFARVLGVSIRTVQGWEQGRRRPTGPAKMLLTAFDRCPALFLGLTRVQTSDGRTYFVVRGRRPERGFPSLAD